MAVLLKIKNKFKKINENKPKLIIFILIILVFYTLCYFSYELWFLRKLPVHKNILKNVIVHLDFKGAAPKLNYLKLLLPMLKNLGVTGLLIEYEDMFPYQGKLLNISAQNCYSRKELSNFLKLVSKLGFEVIPLVQTFGHLEHVLKLKEFKYLREDLQFPDSLCPSKIESKALVRDMIEQIIEFHSSVLDLKHIHVGCDEVFHINKCTQCLNRQMSDIQIYENHVLYLTETVKTINNNIKILIWDDMLDYINIHKSKLIDIEPVTWEYSADNALQKSNYHLKLYTFYSKFKHIWIASAFKGADGRDSITPILKNRFQNHYNWIQFINNLKFNENINGIILTGWSRYSHMDVLCDLLAGSIPSLVINLLLIKQYKNVNFKDFKNQNFVENKIFINSYLNEEFIETLKCPSLKLNFDNFNTTSCDFLESNMYNYLNEIDLINKVIEIELSKGLFKYIDVTKKIKNINMNIIYKYKSWCKDTIIDINLIEKQTIKAMEDFYNIDTINEFIAYKILILKDKLINVCNIITNYSLITDWDRGPHFHYIN